MDVGNFLRNIYIYQSTAITECIASYICNCFRNYYFFCIEHIEEAEYADSLKFAALFKCYALNMMCICKSIVTYRCNILADNNVLDLIEMCTPRLSISCIVVHSTATGNYKLTTCVICPCCIISTSAACYCRDFTLNKFNIPIILLSKFVGTGILNYLNNYFLTTVSKDINLNCFKSSGKFYSS